MKILWVKTDFLHPTDRGGQIRTLETLRYLNAWHQVDYVAFEDSTRPDGPRRANEYSARFWPIPKTVTPKTSPKFALELLRGLADPLPVAVRRWRSAAMLQKITELTAREGFDCVVCDFPFPAPNLPPGLPFVLFQHNVETMIWRRHAEAAADPLRRAYLSKQAERMFAFESAVCRKAAYVIAVSENDAGTMRREFGITHVDDVPTGVDTKFFSPTAEAEPSADIVFMGSMDWMANVDGGIWFLDRVWPRLRARNPTLTMAFVGRDPAPKLRERAGREQGITVTGTVPDVRPWLWGARVSIVPLQAGGGTRLKIYEAMAAKVATISTAIGAEGLPVEDGRHILIADAPKDFADACLLLLEDSARREALREAASCLVSENFSWESSARRFEALLGRA